jgi:hypothetical protein
MNIEKLINTKNIVKYLIFAGIVFSLIKIIPQTPLTNTEKSILLIVSITALIGLDCILPITENFTENKDKDTVVVMGKVLSDMDLKKNVVDVIKERNGDYPTKLLNLTRILKNSKFSNKLIENMIKEGIIGDKELKILFQNQALSKEQLQELVKNNVLKPDVLESITKDIITEKPKDETIDRVSGRPDIISKLEKVKEDVKKISKLLQGEGIENEEELEEELRRLEKTLEQEESKEMSKEEIESRLKEEIKSKVEKEIESKLKEEIKSKDISKIERDLESKLKEKEALIMRKEAELKRKVERDLESKLKEKEALIMRREEELKRKEREIEMKAESDMKYNELPEEFLRPLGEGLGRWSDNEYSILNTDKWRVPMPRPPVCISSSKPCEPCPLMTDGYPLNLKEWNNSRKITNIEINKKWANDQVDSQ